MSVCLVINIFIEKYILHMFLHKLTPNLICTKTGKIQWGVFVSVFFQSYFFLTL